MAYEPQVTAAHISISNNPWPRCNVNGSFVCITPSEFRNVSGRWLIDCFAEFSSVIRKESIAGLATIHSAVAETASREKTSEQRVFPMPATATVAPHLQLKDTSAYNKAIYRAPMARKSNFEHTLRSFNETENTNGHNSQTKLFNFCPQAVDGCQHCRQGPNLISNVKCLLGNQTTHTTHKRCITEATETSLR